MIRYTVSGDTKRTEAFLDKMIRGDLYSRVDAVAKRGVQALQSATPRSSGETADSWTYEIVQTGGSTTVWFNNTHVVDGFNVAVGLQYGHATGTGGYVPGYDYINPALKPIFDDIANGVWEEVRNA